ncbi:GNAT family N-acetyltransferase [Metasolibacillus sp.]|uniref:GNAT family N-acetyltransferase n=1 Tax=Metasolibacillus sp. TaxID=2703680 RepID=UPI0025D47B50|nr:GNAT family N-acetyltransferase [Metasolibacillus sp.]MCT6922904.1 GNAT family N-acetyltransferase [Metasolibacillus sp.]MCT6939142.1 GNAT family N-acetyltransferase [Metasolibacillus sp.]
MKIIPYAPQYEESWLRCRVLAYLHTAMYEDVVTKKPTFDGRPAIELIAVEDDAVIGLIDLVLDTEEQKTTILSEGLGAFLPVIAVHPDHQSRGIGMKMYKAALQELEKTAIEFIELYTRDDVQANNFYQKLGFEIGLETYDVYGTEKKLMKEITVEGIENKKFKVKDANSKPCHYLIGGAIYYEVFDKAALEEIDYERYHVSYGYFKRIK